MCWIAFVILGIKRRKALLLLQTNELEGIVELTDSHTPSLRFKAALQFDKAMTSEKENIPVTINKKNIELSCSDTDLRDRLHIVLDQLSEMPKGK